MIAGPRRFPVSVPAFCGVPGPRPRQGRADGNPLPGGVKEPRAVPGASYSLSRCRKCSIGIVCCLETYAAGAALVTSLEKLEGPRDSPIAI